MAIVTYYGKLKKLWEELANYDQIPTYKCGRCKCNLNSVLQKKREEEKIHQFLMGLDDALYGTVRSNLLAQDPLPTLNKVYATLIQEERLHTVTRTTEDRGEVMAFAVQSNFKRYPDWWGDRQHGQLKGTGHGKPEQYNIVSNNKKRGGAVKAHVAQEKPSKEEVASETSSSDICNPRNITSDQWQTLAILLNNVKLGATEKLSGKCSFLPWIIDTVSQLLKDSNYTVKFTDKFCLIQDPTLRTPIGAGEQREGLYYLKKMVKAAAVKTNKEIPLDLLHRRLGHASLKALQMFPNGDKFAARSRKCVFVGYPYGTKGWRMYDLELGVFFNSRDVVFYENEFPFAAEIPSENDHILPGASFSNAIEDDFFQLVPTIPAVPSTPAIETATLLDKDVSSVTPHVSIESPAGSSSFDSQNMSSFVETSEEPQAADTIKNLGRGHRIKLPSTKLQDFVTNTITKICPSNCFTASSRPSGTPYPLAKYVNYANFSPRHRKFLAAVSAATKPQNFAEAVKNIQW
ncbi:hypothetical protein KIW84_056228 [Lathyrus oleraceus]|uniref:Retroviral polymerase SH3-like domain-containing protein n=1 Tax=Pisum sativum TaxID=3888 RepID=A0A9D4WZX7_PEA|nr:hypothetical protein KIW84_056228 [Pisum sativum]